MKRMPLRRAAQGSTFAAFAVYGTLAQVQIARMETHSVQRAMRPIANQ